MCLLGSLRAIDFNLYVKEQAINKAPFNLDWGKFIGADGVDFDAIEPPLTMPSFIISQFAHLDQGDKTTHSDNISLSPEELMEKVSRLEEENRQLRRAIISQLNQRSFFEEECAKLGKRVNKLQDQMDALAEANQQHQSRERDMQAVIEAHEATNQSLQYQLCQAQITSTERPKTLSLTSLTRSREPESPNEDYTKSLEEKVKRLEIDLLIANGLKDEFKARIRHNS